MIPETPYGTELKSLREYYGVSEREFARLAGLNNSTISLIEKKENRRPRNSTHEKILDAFQKMCEARDLLASVFGWNNRLEAKAMMRTSYGQQVKALRQHFGLSQTKFARLAGLDRKTIQLLEKNSTTKPQGKTHEKILQTFKMLHEERKTRLVRKGNDK